MNIYALLSWFDESPDHLKRCVTSLKGFADCIVTLDGGYATFPDAWPLSPVYQRVALGDAIRSLGVPYKMGEPWRVWQGGEVEKRAKLFELGRTAGATADDWFLIIDADMSLSEFTADARELLAASDRDVAEVRFQNVQVDGMVAGTYRFRSLFRALPGLTVERAHYLYTVPLFNDCCHGGDMGAGCVECASQPVSSRRFLWHAPSGRLSDERIVDLFGHVTLHHFNSSRDGVRKRRALNYYRERDLAGLEAVGDWR